MRYIPEKQIFYNNKLNSSTISLNQSLQNDTSSFASEDVLYDATVSRFSDFGYTNDKYGIIH